jgi:hypothetical protein
MTTRSTKSLRSGAFSIIPAAAVFDTRLSNADIRVLAALGTYADKQRRCWPAVPTLARRTGMSARHVYRCLEALAQSGFVAIESRSGQSNLYQIPLTQASRVSPNPGHGCQGGMTPVSGDPGHGCHPNDIKNDTNNDYAFSGAIIRLTWRDFSAWQEAYKAIPDLRAALQQRDDWLATLPESDQRRKNWLVPTSNWLAKENQKQAASRVQSEPAYDPDVIH